LANVSDISGKRKHRSKTPVFDGRPAPKISELLMSRLQGTPSEKLAWLQKEKSAGKLDGDDPEEVAEAEAMLAMLVRISGSKVHKQRKHVDELLDDALMGTFPASDPVSVGHFTGTELGR
jgi:hypothetical protein